MVGFAMRRLALSVALGASLALGGCGGEAEAPEAPPEGIVPGIEISNARLVLPPVPGNPAAIYFDLVYTGDRGISISGAEVESAGRAELHDMMEYNFEMTMAEGNDIALSNGTEVTFEPGAKHIMAFDLAEDLQAGDTTEVTLKISGGSRHTFEAPVQAAGDER